MKRKEYRRPEMMVVELQQYGMLMTSGLRNGYGKANTGVDPDDLDGDGNWVWD